MCKCIFDMKKRLEDKGYEYVQPPVEVLSGRVYISFTAREAGKKKYKEVPVLLSKCPICGKPYERELDPADIIEEEKK